MNIAIFGLGYVGSVSAACLAAAGHRVIGVDLDPNKLALLRSGRAPVSEPGLDELLGRMIAEDRVSVTDDATAAVQASDLSLVCVATPSRPNGSLDTTYLERVMAQIGKALAGQSAYHVVAVRSTVLPGVVEGHLVPILQESSGRRVPEEVGVCVNPEFLREGSALADFEQPPFTIVGETHPKAGEVLLQAYAHLGAPVHRVRPDEASMVKYASNNYHAIKVAFANEIGAVCSQLGADGHTVMRIFCEDHDLNISPKYLRPGFGFGGSCLPKDLRALVYVAKDRDLHTPLLDSVIPSNDAHIKRVVDAILEKRKRKVALLGLSFKNGSDDLRESPFVRLAEALIGKGVPLRIFDPDVELTSVFGRNRAYIEDHLPHVAQLAAATIDEAIADAEIIVVGKKVVDGATLQAAAAGRTVIDLVGVPELAGALRPWASASASMVAASGA
ncbi:GDP-mannose 6-dehydrogenase [Luteitalea sp. TBR-22]|uniref:nucleotide sugar dehydrogenase n=1 Tax=Luteitalea sp. TBR-22 TaxID=2802971 RepID=UPI001AF49D55|nr:nucleotide sugar dehydrogenase [Luteitalea sp. TBR-22]BCS33203.1 GDP-mannose 6-dehydrogenase [Luteitalea sp. TBR-22]